MKPDLSEDQIAGLLERVLGSPPVKLLRLREGRDSQAFGFTHGRDDLVLRVRTDGEGFRKEEMLQQRLNGPALPIPLVLVWGPVGPRHHFCISEHAAGITLEDADATTVAGTLDATLEALTAIHQTPIDWTNGFGVVDADGRAPFGTWLGCSREVGRGAAQPLRGILGSDAKIPLQRYAALIERCPEDRALIHRDFGSNNVITDGTQITAVLDWDAAGCGDTLYDVGTALFWRTWLRCFDQLYEHCSMGFSHLPAYGARVLAYALAAGFGEVASCAAEGDGCAGEWAARRCVQLLGET